MRGEVRNCFALLQIKNKMFFMGLIFKIIPVKELHTFLFNTLNDLRET